MGDLFATLAATIARLTAERDSARNVAVRLEQELAELRRMYGLDS